MMHNKAIEVIEQDELILFLFLSFPALGLYLKSQKEKVKKERKIREKETW